MSGDKDNDGTAEQLGSWKQIMSLYDGAKVPYFAGVGNHDRKAPPGTPPGTTDVVIPAGLGDLSNYKGVFADRPYPFGDATPYQQGASGPGCATPPTRRARPRTTSWTTRTSG